MAEQKDERREDAETRARIEAERKAHPPSKGTSPNRGQRGK